MKDIETKTKKTTLNLSEELHAEAKAEAARLRISLTELITRALQLELARIKEESSKSRRTVETLGKLDRINTTTNSLRGLKNG